MTEPEYPGQPRPPAEGQQPAFGQPQQPYGDPQYPYGNPYAPPGQPQYPYGQQQPPHEQASWSYQQTTPQQQWPTAQYPAAADGSPPATSHRAQWLTVIAAVLIAAGVGAYFLFSGSDANASTPTKVVSALLDAGKANDRGAAKKLLCKADANDETVNQLASSGRVTSYKINSVQEIDTTHALVNVTVTTQLTKTGIFSSVPVVKENGSWKVCPSGGFGGIGPGTGPSAAAPTPSVPPSPSTVTTPPIGIPTLVPSGLPGINPCAAMTDARATAIAYMGMAELGYVDYAQACVYDHSVPRSVTAGLKTSGTGLYAPTGGGAGSTITFASIDGTATVDVTVVRKNGQFYVTKVAKR